MGKWFLELMMLESELIVREYSKRTIEFYKKTTEEFLNFTNKSPESFTKEDIQEYLEYQIKVVGLSKNTIMTRFNAIEFFIVKVLGMDITETIEKFEREYKNKELITESEFLTLVSHDIGERNRAMYYLAYYLGLSAEELSELNREDFDVYNENTLEIERRQESIKIKENKVIEVLNKWIEKREFLVGVMKETAMFINQDYKRLNNRSIGRWLLLDCEEFGINKKVSFKTLKYSRAYELVTNGKEKEAKELLGYREMDRVYRYFKEIGHEIKK